MKNDTILEVASDVKWIGILDTDIVTFDVVMETQYGTTYNSYFINADKKAVIDTAKEKFVGTYLEKIRKVTPPEEIEYIIMNHTEPDHSGSLSALLELAPEATVVGTGNALRYLEDIIGKPFRSMKVKDGDTLDLGNKTLRFIGAPNLHWPDTMYTWIEEDRLLFTCDSFGCHYCDEKMFDDRIGDFDEAFKYYFDVILKPYSKFMLKAIDKIRDLDISAVAPGHGPILRKNWKKYVQWSEKMASEYLEQKEHDIPEVLIAYVTAYGYTQEMARAIGRGLGSEGNIKVHLANIEHMPLGEMEELLTRADAIIVGTPTINKNTLLPVYKLLSAVNPLRDNNKPAAAFGSYGWSGEGPEIVASALQKLRLNVIGEPQKVKFALKDPANEKQKMLEDFGKLFSREVRSFAGENTKS